MTASLAAVRRGPSRLGYRAIPWFLRKVLLFSLIPAVLPVLFLVAAIFGKADCTSLNGPGGRGLACFTPPSLWLLLGFEAAGLATAVSVWTEQLHSRLVVLLVLLSPVAVGFVDRSAFGWAAVPYLVVWALLGLYLYAASGPRTYYARLRQERRGGA